jgi:hypothetical protein
VSNISIDETGEITWELGISNWELGIGIYLYNFMEEKLPVKKPHEKAQLKKLESKEDAYVFEQFHNADFKIENFQDLYTRVKEIHSKRYSHFEDAADMANIASRLWEKIKSGKEIKLTKNKFKLACLFHDIGKSGPANANPRQRYLIEKLFDPTYFNPRDEKFKDQRPRNMSINDALDMENMLEKEEMKEYLSTLTVHIYDLKTKKNKEEKLDIKKHQMIDFWREHDYWTRDILMPYIDDQIDEAVAHVAGTHNALDGRDPWHIDGDLSDESINLEIIDKYYLLKKEEVIDKSLVLTLFDQYQAWIDRSGFTHDKAIEEIEKYIEYSKNEKIINHENRIYNKFIKYLGILRDHKELADIVKKK